MYVHEKGIDITMLLRMLGGVSRLLKSSTAKGEGPAKPENSETVDKQNSQPSPNTSSRPGVQTPSGKPQTQSAFQNRTGSSFTQGVMFYPEKRTLRQNISDVRRQNPNPEVLDKNQDRLHTVQTQLFMVESPDNAKPMPLFIESRLGKGRENPGKEGGHELSMFLLLENTGGVFLTVSSKGGKIGISFDVENNRLHDAFCAYLDELQSVIPESENLRIRVQVAPEKILSKIDLLSRAFHLDLTA